MNSQPRVFFSYSWDNPENQEWILALVADLRNSGVLADLDINQTQKGLVHLDTMMANNVRDNDYIITVFTPDYVMKADAQIGGVGVETRLIMNVLKSNPNRVIPILLESTEGTSPVPFYLGNYMYIDFRAPGNYQIKFKELLHRIFNKNLIDLPDVGQPPQLLGREIQGHLQRNLNVYPAVSNERVDLVPNLKKITDRDKNKYMNESYNTIISTLDNLLARTGKSNQNFESDKEIITNQKNVYKLYVDGNLRFTLKIWLGTSFGGSTPSINLSYDNTFTHSDNSFNEMIRCETNAEKILGLKMTMRLMNGEEIMSPNAVAEEIWSTIVARIK
ncbi:toll/interleukin-1 receptor domain-containing protein [Trichococcus flocculiformis]|uniref:toll/interleukin-1 receptor domain-containing protein n=1 Tax=Trichococcus flocculiformis TaxID=82803 RepID=UPI002AAB2FC9|nr:toll/interleukin-1 receptor domain-containing protein [Trichococcus flocculiformis]